MAEEDHSMSKHGAAVIGVGSAGGDFIRIFQQNDQTKLIAVCDVNEAQLATAAGKVPGVATAADFHDIAERDDIAVVAICTPDHLHAEPAIAMMEAGKHVIIEKPMVTTWEDLRRVTETAHRTGRIVAHCTQLRWMPLNQEVKRRVAQGKLGELYLAEADYGGYSLSLFANGWRGEAGINYNPVAGGGVHILDLLLWFIDDEVEEVFGCGNRKCITQTGLDTFDCVSCIIKFRNGCVARSTTSFGTDRAIPGHIELCGTEGCYLSAPEPKIGYGAQQPQYELLTPQPAGDLRGLLVNDMIDAIEKDREPLTNLTEATKVVSVCIAAYESAATGRPVRMKRD